MNINELFEELKKRNISLSGRAISQIWGMAEETFSKKKKTGTQIKQKNIMQLEDALGIKLIGDTPNNNTLDRCYDDKIDHKIDGIGNRLLELKDKNNMSDLKLAALLDISESELTSIITGKTLPDWRVIKNLKQNFKISIDWLLFGE